MVAPMPKPASASSVARPLAPIICVGFSTPSTSLRASSSASLPRQGAPVFSLNYDQTEASAARHFAERTFLFLGRTTRPALTIDWSKLRPYSGEAPDLTPPHQGELQAYQSH